MKKLTYSELVLVIGIFVGCSSSFDGIKDSDVTDFEKTTNTQSGNIYIYSDPATPPIPNWFISNSEIDLDDYDIEDEYCQGCIIKSSGSYKVKSSDDNGFEGSNKIAWQHARKKFFDSWVERFNISSNTVGSNADARIGEEKSFYELISKNEKGISPLTELKSFYAYNKTKNSYTCFSIYFVRIKELENRIGAIKDSESRTRFDKAVEKYLN